MAPDSASQLLPAIVACRGLAGTLWDAVQERRGAGERQRRRCSQASRDKSAAALASFVGRYVRGSPRGSFLKGSALSLQGSFHTPGRATSRCSTLTATIAAPISVARLSVPACALCSAQRTGLWLQTGPQQRASAAACPLGVSASAALLLQLSHFILVAQTTRR